MRTAAGSFLIATALIYCIPTSVPAQQRASSERTTMVGGAAMYPSKNIVLNAVSSKDHTTLVAAVKAAGLVDVLEGPGPFTVFAPTNEAFTKLPAGNIQTLLQPGNKQDLELLLKYHVLPGKLTFSALAKGIAEGRGILRLKTLEGEDLAFKRGSGQKIVIVDSKGNESTLTIPDAMQSNGVIHVVDNVLIPEFRTASASGRIPIPNSVDIRDHAKGPAKTCAKGPDFMPWPPPKATSSYGFAPSMVHRFKTLGDFDAALLSTLNGAGYFDFSYFQTPGGYALATPIERIDSQGSPASGGSRWKDSATIAAPTSFLDWLTKILYNEEGNFRVFVFVVTTDGDSSSQAATFVQATRWAEEGCRGLPASVMSAKIAQREIAYALTYVFSGAKGQEPKQIYTFESTAEQFARSGIKF